MDVKSLLKLSRMLNSGTKKAPPPTPAAVATEPICALLNSLKCIAVGDHLSCRAVRC